MGGKVVKKMAREIKIVKEANGELNVRNPRDTCARGETVVAARWQDGEVKAFADSVEVEEFLSEQCGYSVALNSDSNEFSDYLAKNF